MEEVMAIRRTETKRISLRKEAKERRDALVAAGKCLGCECELSTAKRVSRGLCVTCYAATRYAIRRGRTTDEELLRRGMILPPDTGGQKPVNSFTSELCGRS